MHIIMITNDDGISSDGLFRLVKAAGLWRHLCCGTGWPAQRGFPQHYAAR